MKRSMFAATALLAAMALPSAGDDESMIGKRVKGDTKPCPLVIPSKARRQAEDAMFSGFDTNGISKNIVEIPGGRIRWKGQVYVPESSTRNQPREVLEIKGDVDEYTVHLIQQYLDGSLDMFTMQSLLEHRSVRRKRTYGAMTLHR